MYAFDIERPTTVAEAVNALKTDEAQPLGGGQTLIPTLKARLAAPSKLVSLSAIAEMIGISREGSTIRIGGATTHGQVATELAESYPALGYLASKIGDPA
ncbi:FAD binding domain-containing protein, partial [Pseudophaeobacter sp.]